jgi:hypothetical protein
MLTDMAVFGNGQWPKHWKLRADDLGVLQTLHRKGLVTSVGRYAALTRSGETVAAHLRGDPPLDITL